MKIRNMTYLEDHTSYNNTELEQKIIGSWIIGTKIHKSQIVIQTIEKSWDHI
jgi:hypothetical protein